MTTELRTDTVKGFQLLGEDGNAMAIMGNFRRCARRDGWTAEEVDAVTKQAMSGDYNELLVLFMGYVDEDLDDEDEDDEDWE